MELVRELLLSVEADRNFTSLVAKYTEEVVIGHVEILLDANLLVGKVRRDLRWIPGSAVVQRLTWAGHEFLDNARNDTVWRKVMAKIKEKALSVSFDIVGELLKDGVAALVAG